LCVAKGNEICAQICNTPFALRSGYFFGRKPCDFALAALPLRTLLKKSNSEGFHLGERRFTGLSSVGLERCFDRAEVTGSNPVDSTGTGGRSRRFCFRAYGT
jgi:hypothetical protein